jgi:hypothetical protein
LSRRLKLLPVLAFAAATVAGSAAFADAGTTPSNCFQARDLLGWKSPSPNVILYRVSPNRVWRLDLQEGSDQLKYSDVHLTNRNMKSAWLCAPADFNLLLSDSHNTFTIPLIVTAVRQLTPDEIAALPPQDRP